MICAAMLRHYVGRHPCDVESAPTVAGSAMKCLQCYAMQCYAMLCCGISYYVDLMPCNVCLFYLILSTAAMGFGMWIYWLDMRGCAMAWHAIRCFIIV